jgi:uncharacterized protein
MNAHMAPEVLPEESRPPAPLAPRAPEERLVLVDGLRGVALLGILLVNMGTFSHGALMANFGATGAPAGVDRWLGGALTFLAEGKFYSIFSLLFGLGLFLQMSRAEQAGVAFVGRWRRRVLVLLGFGVTHAVLIWDGDILIMYALLGLALPWFRRASNRALVSWATAFIVLEVLALVGLAALLRLPAVAQEIKGSMAELTAELDSALRLHQQGSYVALVAHRARETALSEVGMLLMIGPAVLSLFLLGVWSGRKGLLHDPGAHRQLLGRLLVGGLAIGIPANLVLLGSHQAIYATPGIVPEDLSAVLTAVAALMVAGPAIATVYLSGAALAWLRPGPKRWLSAVAPVGRMALTNYLLQSIICTTLFFGYGLGLQGKLGIAGGVVLALAIYAGQVALSRWWLSRHRFGPAEWLWRTLTYGTRPPMVSPPR